MNNSIEISVRGQWVSVPALEVQGQTIVVKGGLVRIAAVHDEIWQQTEVVDPEACVEALKAQSSSRIKADLFSFTQKPSSPEPKYAYHREMDSVAVARFATFQEWWESLPQESRKNVRRAQKRSVEVVVRSFDDELVRGILGVNNDSATRQRTRNHHYGKTFEQTKRDHSAFLDRSEFIGAYVGDEMIGYAKIVYRGEMASLLNFAPKASHKDKRPANALLAKAIELCDTKGITCLTYGMFNYGNKQESPLREFKERNGFQEVLVPRYYVPLTLRGRVCLGAGLHRGLLGILPHSVITLAGRARAKWYAAKEVLGSVGHAASHSQAGSSSPTSGSEV
jgi:hypothetical protein